MDTKANQSSRLTSTNMDSLFRQTFVDILKHQSLVYNQISSFDEFVGSEYGIKAILEQMFAVNNIVQIEPGKVIEHNGVNKQVGSMELSINFENVQIRQVDTESEEIHDLSV